MASGDLSLTSTSSQEEEGSDFVTFDRPLRPPSNSSNSTSATNVANNNGNNSGGGGGGVASLSNNNNNSTGSGNSGGSALSGIPSAKKYDNIKTQYDSALRELTALRHQHSDTMRRCDDLSSQLSFYQEEYMAAINQLKTTDRGKDLTTENVRLKQQIGILERKLLLLEQDNTNSNSNSFYRDYGDTATPRAKCDGTCTESEKLMEELHLFRERNTDMAKDRLAIASDREKYKKNFNSALAELENVKKERNFYRESREQLNAQRDMIEKENQKLNILLAAERNQILILTVKHSRVEEELNQLLSEKDNVLQEHQKMSDDLVVANKQLEILKKDEQMYKNEMKMLQQANAELKKRDLVKSRESSWSKEFSDSKDDFKEIEKLRKNLEKAHFEVERALQDAEEAKRVRDWAISQREKIVLERDSVKTLCDNLRKERDKAISDLLSAIRDSEKIKKQKDEAQKKIDALREQIEGQNMDIASRRTFRLSTYGADDMLDIELCNYHADSEIGIILDDHNNRQLVCGVTNLSPAFGKLKINDVICKVNNHDCQGLTKRRVLEEIRGSAPHCNLQVLRTRQSKRHFYTVHLNMQENGNHGLSFDTGVFISKIEPNSLAGCEPELDIGDRVLSINNKSMEGVQSVENIMDILNDGRNESITIFALKNVQDISYIETQRRMTTSSAQTDIDSNDPAHRTASSSRHPSKITELLSKLLKLHPSKAGSESDNFAQEKNDALAALDSVLSENSSEKSKENLFKRSKRSKKEKETAAKSMGTWPTRTTVLNTHENSTGTIVHREKKRAPLSLFTAGPINVDKDDERSDDQPPPLPPQIMKPPLNMRNTSGSGGGGNATNESKNKLHRNSNPIPVAIFQSSNSGSENTNGPGVEIPPNNYQMYMRHTIFGSPTSLESDPLLMEQHMMKPLVRPGPIAVANMRVKIPSDKYNNSGSGGNQRSHNIQNRYSLNITPTELYKSNQQQHQYHHHHHQVAHQQQMQHQQMIGAGGAAAGGANEFLSRKSHLFENLNGPKSGNNQLPHTALFTPLHPSNNYGRSVPMPIQQQNSLDVISLKSQNSIDSILSAKSPPISEYAVNYLPSKRNMATTQLGTTGPVIVGAKNVAKYPSDSESIASANIGLPTNGPGNGLFQLNNMPHNRHAQLFPTFAQQTPTHFHTQQQQQQQVARQIRHSSPLTLPSSPPVGGLHSGAMDVSGMPGTSVDKFEMDLVSPTHNHHHHHHGHTQFLNDYAGSTSMTTHHHHHQQPMPHYHPHAGMVTGGVAGTAIYEGGTFPRKKDHQRLRIPSNPSVTSKNNTVKNSSGSIDNHFGSVGPVNNNSNNNNSTINPTNSAMPLSQYSSITSPNISAMMTGNGGSSGGGSGSGRASPMPQVHVEVLSHGGSKRHSNVPTDFPCPGDLRRVTIEKSDKSLGITIQCNNNGGGIFVSTVADKSIATRAGLQVGDQLLEVCGLNMRSATNDIAANVLRQCGNSITMLVQYNPEKFHSADYEGSHNMETESPINHSGSPTPRNSPHPPARSMISPLSPMSIATLPPLRPSPTILNSTTVIQPSHMPLSSVQSQMPTVAKSLRSSSAEQTLKEPSYFGDENLENQSDINNSQSVASSSVCTTSTAGSTSSSVYEEQSRYVTLHMDKSKNLGIKLFGGNKVGIFVHDVHEDSPSDRAGIRMGDQILEYNGVDLRGVTAEQAATEISKSTDSVTMRVQNKLKKLKQIKDKSGDSFYIRVGFERSGDVSEGELRFAKDEVLYVDNTIFNGTFGMWRAWKLDAKGHRKECGIIPSQMRVEEELRVGELVECDGAATRRGSTSARRSFFRRKKHQRSSSRDSTEIASFSNTQLSFFPDSGILNEDGGILSYQRVERLESPVRRPVLIIGPLSECVMERLTMDFSNLFKLCEVTSMDCSQETMEEGLQEYIFVDYRRRGNNFECTTVEAIKNACKNDRRHCILDISVSAVERLQRLHIYPIVLLLRFKSAKQIREIRDFGNEKISAKAAKEMYERALRLEADYKQYISAVIPGVNIKHMCTQIKDSVDKEQDKLLWVPVSNV